MHGLGGSGALYLLTFGAGVCVGMFALTLFLVGPAVVGLSRFKRVNVAIRAVAGLASVALGVFMWVQILPALRA